MNEPWKKVLSAIIWIIDLLIILLVFSKLRAVYNFNDKMGRLINRISEKIKKLI